MIILSNKHLPRFGDGISEKALISATSPSLVTSTGDLLLPFSPHSCSLHNLLFYPSNFFFTPIMNLSSDINILSLNVNGLNDVRKRRLVFNTLRKFRRSIILLQETHCRPGNANLWKSQWGHDMVLTDISASSGGVAILFSRDLKPIFKETSFAGSNRFILTRVRVEESNFCIMNVYMPTSDKEQDQILLMEELSNLLPDETEEEDTLILGGDFNVSMNDSLDRKGYSTQSIRNPTFRDNLNSFLSSRDLSDLWRIQNPKKRARLDYIFVPHTFGGHLHAHDPKSYSFSDHRLVSLAINPTTLPRGKGFWKLKTSLLQGGL